RRRSRRACTRRTDAWRSDRPRTGAGPSSSRRGGSPPSPSTSAGPSARARDGSGSGTARPQRPRQSQTFLTAGPPEAGEKGLGLSAGASGQLEDVPADEVDQRGGGAGHGEG